MRVAITAPTAKELADQIWDSLDADNKVSLYVRYVDLRNGFPEVVIRNKLGEDLCRAPKAPVWRQD